MELSAFHKITATLLSINWFVSHHTCKIVSTHTENGVGRVAASGNFIKHREEVEYSLLSMLSYHSYIRVQVTFEGVT
jgi:hypothetical protein